MRGEEFHISSLIELNNESIDLFLFHLDVILRHHGIFGCKDVVSPQQSHQFVRHQELAWKRMKIKFFKY